MQKLKGDRKLSRRAQSRSATQSPARLIAVGFALSVALPIGWGLTSGSASAQEKPAHVAPAPRNTAELFALAANVAKKQQRVFSGHAVGDTGEFARASRESEPTPVEKIEAAPESAFATPEPVIPEPVSIRDRADEREAPEFLARTTENPELPPTVPSVSEPRSAERPAMQAAAEVAREIARSTRTEPKSVLMAESAVSETRVSAATLLQRGAPAPHLSAVGAVTSRSAREVANTPRAETAPAMRRDAPRTVDTATGSPSRGTTSGPTPATQKEIQAARDARAAALSGSTAPQTTRRRVAMHRMAAAAASSLNEATPFRTANSGSSRFAGVGAGESLGDSLNAAAEAIAIIPGLRLENVQLGAGYSSNGLPGARSVYSRQGAIGGDMDYNAQATLAFRKRFRTSSFGLTYTPSRNQRYRFPEWNSTDHVAGFRYDRQFGRRWGVALNANLANTGLEQFWMRQPVFRRVENPPTSFEELVQRVEAGEFTDDEFASILTGAPIVEEPGGRELALTRVNSVNTSASVSYAHSARTTFVMGLSSSRYETSSLGRSSSGDFAVNNLSRHSAYLEGGYKFSPSMTAGVRYNANTNDSTFGRSYSQGASVFLRRRLSRFWSAEGQAGGGFSNIDRDSGYLQQVQGVRNGIPSWTAGGSLEYRYGGHSFSAFGRRQIGDNLGLSSATSMSGGLNWEWATPRMPWVLSGGASYSTSDWGFDVLDQGSRSFETALLQAGLSRRLTPTTAFSTGYYFGRYQSPFTGLLTGSTVHRVQASFLWRPVEAR